MSFGVDLTDSFGGFSVATPPDGCTQCGMCLSSCPTYAVSQDPEQSPMGRIRLIRALANDPADAPAPEQTDKLAACLGCYSCESACPSKVAFGQMLDEALARIREQQPAPAITRAMLWLAGRTVTLGAAVRGIYVAQRLGLRTLARKVGLIRGLGLQRADALLGTVQFPRRLHNRVEALAKDRRVALFTGCFSTVMERDVHQATIDVLNAVGIEVTRPSGQGCCGALHRHNGDPATAERLARANLDAFAFQAVDAIISTSSGCGASLKRYGDWLDGESLPAPVTDVNQYLAVLLRWHQPPLRPLPLKVALHTPCTLRQHEGQQEAVLELLQRVPGLEVLPLSDQPRCCGAGGSQVLADPDMADALREEVLNALECMDVDVILTSNLGCAMHLRAGLTLAGMELPVRHPVQLVADALSARPEQ